MASPPKGTSSTLLSCLAKRDLCELLGTIEASLTVNTVEDLKAVVRRVTRLVPCDYAIATLSDCDVNGRPRGLSTIVNVSYPVPWATRYLARGYAKIDPILQAHFQRPRTQVWSDTYRLATSPREKEFVGAARTFGLTQGVTLGVAGLPSTRSSLFSFAGAAMGEHERHPRLLERILPHLHVALSRVAGHRPRPTKVLSPRELEVLKWVREGKTNWEISQILTISERTVKFHVQNVLAKLQASTRGQATALAIHHRLIPL